MHAIRHGRRTQHQQIFEKKIAIFSSEGLRDSEVHVAWCQTNQIPHTSMHSNSIFPRWAFVVLAVITATIGLSASWVTAQFFILGLERLEPDPLAKGILVIAGVLMIVTELAAFGIAALLPRQKFASERKRLIATGLVLLAFEAITICVTQGALDKSTETAAHASIARMDELKLSINARRTSAESLRTNGTTQSASSNAWTRTLGAAALRDALKVEAQIEPLANELAQLQASARPTTTSVLGERGTMFYGIAKGLLISSMGVIMFGVAGSLLAKGLGFDSHLASEAATIAAPTARTNQIVGGKTASKERESLAGKQVDPRPTAIQLGKDWCRKMLKRHAGPTSAAGMAKAAI